MIEVNRVVMDGNEKASIKSSSGYFFYNGSVLKFNITVLIISILRESEFLSLLPPSLMYMQR